MNFWRKKKKKKNSEANQRLRLFQENGKVVLEDLIELCNGQSNPIKTYSANEILEATDNFSEKNHLVRFEFMYRGMLENRPVLIKRPVWRLYTSDTLEKICRDIAVSSMVSGHKNFLKLLGCCLEFEYPVLVCEYAERIPYKTPNLGMFSWGLGTRIKIAKEIAIAVSYLHTAFSTTMIHMDIQPSNIFLDSNGTAKLSGFCLCVSIPEGETYVKVDAERVEGVLDYLEYKYVTSGVVTENTDVFSFGVLLQSLLTRNYEVVDYCSSSDDDESLFECQQNLMKLRVSDRISKCVEEDRIFEILDPKMLESIGDDEHERQRMEAVLMLSLRCTGHRGHIPKMMEVAKELKRIERWT
uniref:Putative inactive receptor-like protein kinase n=1 Tax=Noccaea caerulescens TaxID=107243 RepID=A0A1J3E722_NOCCA